MFEKSVPDYFQTVGARYIWLPCPEDMRTILNSDFVIYITMSHKVLCCDMNEKDESFA